MSVAEGLDGTSSQDQHAYWPCLPHQWHAQKSTSFSDLQCFYKGELSIGLDVFDLYRAAVKHDPTDHVSSIYGERMVVKEISELRRKAEAGDAMIRLAFGKRKRRSLGSAQLRCLLWLSLPQRLP
jgi:hypothetical protein